jgi:hypothetical protein
MLCPLLMCLINNLFVKNINKRIELPLLLLLLLGEGRLISSTFF